MEYPDWVLKHKTKGTNISCIKGKYYLYTVTSKWDKEKGRSQKITKGYLGRITEDGIIPPKRLNVIKKPNVTVKEYGATKFLLDIGNDILDLSGNLIPSPFRQVFRIWAFPRNARTVILYERFAEKPKYKKPARKWNESRFPDRSNKKIRD